MTELLHRAVTLELSARAGTDDQLEFSASSETPVMRGWEREVLSHASESVNMERMQTGAPVLFAHDDRIPIGVVRSARIDGRRLRVSMQWSKNARAREIRQDVEDGVIRGVSIGYSIERSEVTAAGDPPTVTATRWTPHEVSIVAVPADTTVGIGRSAERSRTHTAQRIGIRNMENPTEEIQTRENEVADIVALATEHNMSERASEWIRTRAPIGKVREEILSSLRSRAGEPTASGRADFGSPDLSNKERKMYSLCKVIRSHFDKNVDTGFEREVSRDLARRMGRESSGYFIPFSVLSERATLTSIGTNTGKETVFTQPGEFIDMLRNRMLVAELGARLIPGLQGNVAFPRLTGSAGASWVTEAPAGGLAASNLTLDQVTLTPKQLQSTTQISRLVAIQSTPAIEEMVRQDLIAAHAIAIDLAVLNGTGTSNQPTGILNVSGTNLVSMGTNGATATLAKLLEAEKAVEAANALSPNASYVTTPAQRSSLRSIQRFTSTDTRLWSDDARILGTRAFATQQMPSDLAKGTGTNLSALIYGDFSQVLIGQWGGGFELIVDPYTLATRNMIQLTSYETCDIAIRQPAAFSKIVDLI